MKIKSGFELQKVLDEYLVMAYGKQNINFTRIISLNETGAYLFENLIGKDFTEDDPVNLLLAEYDVDEQRARTDVQHLLEQWKEVGLIE